MKNIHLTDEILQAYLLKETQDDTIAAHLATCTECRQRLEEYQFLTNIRKVKPETFSFDATALVMQKIVQYQQRKSKKQDLVFWAMLLVLGIGVSSLAIPFIPKIRDVFYAQSIFSTLLVLGTGLFLLLFLLADVRQQYKSKENKLFPKVQPHL